MNDYELLRRYLNDGSQGDFAQLVGRHVNLVYSAANRLVRDPHLAEDVTQQTFVLLARKGGQLGSDTILSAWLYRAALHLASETLRRDGRRHRREQLAVEAMSLATPEAAWQQIEPMLDEAMADLNATEQAAVMLRYFENKSLKEVGAALSFSEDAAQKRVSRAVERLREFFAKRGVTVGASGLVVVISANAIQAAPVGLAATISTAAALAGTTIAATATATATKAIALNTAQTILITAVIVAAVSMGIYEARKVQTLRKEQVPLAAAYQVSGSTIVDFVKNDGSIKTVSNWFRVVVADCRSRITAGGMGDPRVEYFEYCCDGKNSSLLIKYFPGPVKLANQATLNLNTGPVPEYGNGQISQVWLAYASACFYQRSTPGRTDPVLNMGNGFRENHLKVKSEWKLTTSLPPVLEHMCDFSDGYRYNEQDGILLKEKWPSPFDKGSTNATYSVLQWTNYQGLTLPSEWQVIQYKPNLETGRLEPWVTTSGYTASVGTGAVDMNFAPSVPKVTRVIDNTLEAQGVPLRAYDYLAADGRLRTLAEIKRDPDFNLRFQEDAKKFQTAPATR